MKYINVSKISQLLPRGKFKESLKKIYYQHVSRACEKWYKLNDLIKDTVLLQDGECIYIELNNGLRFYDKRLPQQSEDPCYKYGKKEKMKKLKTMKEFRHTCLRLYQEMYTDQHWKFELDKGDIVIDAGAEIGSFAIKAANIVGAKGKVIAIEPDINNLAVLKKNIEANRLRNVVVVPKGLWSKRCVKKFYLDYWPGLHSLFENRPGSPLRRKLQGRSSAEIEVDTLDNILRDLKIKHVDLMKMDIEGAEIEALKGAESILNMENLKLVIEAFHEVNGQPTYKVIIPFLQKRGFSTVLNKQLYVIYSVKRPQQSFSHPE